VVEALHDLVEASDGAGAAVSVAVEGRTVVEAAAGAQTDGAAWTPDSLVCVFSVTKGAATIVLGRLRDRGLLDVEEPIAAYWPEFAAGGKEAVLVRHFLAHTSGVPLYEELNALIAQHDLALFDHDPMAAMLEAAEPQFPVGGPPSYHHLAFGTIASELCRRIDGRSLGQVFRDEVAGPLAAGVHIGTPAAIPVNDVLAPLRSEERAPGLEWAQTFLEDLCPMLNTPTGRRAEHAAISANASARGLARLYAPLAIGGGGLVGEETCSLFAAEAAAVELPDGHRLRRGLGFMLFPELEAAGVPPTAYGHDGAGGSIGFADPEARLSLGFVRSRLSVRGLQPTADLVRAVYQCL
jgi:CubicO group peptidase (beta-lactamase class C family)